MTQATEIRVPSRAAKVNGLSVDLGRFFLASLQSLQLWYERSRQRRRLAQLDGRLLQDIGIDRVAAMKEASKPFWCD
jgi:uncharacterized protein YjiS (DUF1127 family)